MNDDDWFESALGEGEDDGESENGDDAGNATADGDATGDGERTDAADAVDPEDADDTAAAASGSDGVHGGDAGNVGGGGPFDDVGAEAGDVPFPGGSDGDGGSGGGDPFAGLDEGFGGLSGGSEGFDEAEADFDSDIARVDVGIRGLDEMILGGVPERSLMAVVGSAGTGKTTFGLQFLNEVLDDGGKGVYFTLEESSDAIVSTAEEKGWPYRRYREEGDLAVVAMDPVEMANSLDSLRDDISRLVTEFDADRLVLDSVSLLETMYDHPSKRRSEVFDFARSLKRAGVTTMLTSEASTGDPYASRHGIVEYLADAVFVLQYVRPSNFRETRLAVEIQKIRDANHSRETKPYEITDDGIAVYRQANIF